MRHGATFCRPKRAPMDPSSAARKKFADGVISQSEFDHIVATSSAFPTADTATGGAEADESAFMIKNLDTGDTLHIDDFESNVPLSTFNGMDSDSRSSSAEGERTPPAPLADRRMLADSIDLDEDESGAARQCDEATMAAIEEDFVLTFKNLDTGDTVDYSDALHGGIDTFTSPATQAKLEKLRAQLAEKEGGSTAALLELAEPADLTLTLLPRSAPCNLQIGQHAFALDEAGRTYTVFLIRLALVLDEIVTGATLSAAPGASSAVAAADSGSATGAAAAAASAAAAPSAASKDSGAATPSASASASASAPAAAATAATTAATEAAAGLSDDSAAIAVVDPLSSAAIDASTDTGVTVAEYEDSWTVFRRYSDFRKLMQQLKALRFPPPRSELAEVRLLFHVVYD